MIDRNIRDRPTIQRWLREPLLQFLFAGLLLFAAYRALHPAPDPREQPGRIKLTEDDLRQLSVAWLAQGRPAPTAEQPAFEEVEADVKSAWEADQRAAVWRKAYEEMRAKYELVLPAAPMANPRSDATPPARATP